MPRGYFTAWDTVGSRWGRASWWVGGGRDRSPGKKTGCREQQDFLGDPDEAVRGSR